MLHELKQTLSEKISNKKLLLLYTSLSWTTSRHMYAFQRFFILIQIANERPHIHSNQKNSSVPYSCLFPPLTWKRSLVLIQCPVRNPNILSAAQDFPNHQISPPSLLRLASTRHGWTSLLEKHAPLLSVHAPVLSVHSLLQVFVNSPTFSHFPSTCGFKPQIDVLSTYGEILFSPVPLSVKPEKVFPPTDVKVTVLFCYSR